MDLFRWLRNAGGAEFDPGVLDGAHTPAVRRRCRFFGIVQGVGFRYEAVMLASQLGLTGWVRNESDGTVSAEIEGERARVDAFLRGMQSVSRFDITEVQTEDLPVLKSERTFRVRY